MIHGKIGWAGIEMKSVSVYGWSWTMKPLVLGSLTQRS